MLTKRTRDAFFIFLGDLIFFYFALWLAFSIRTAFLIEPRKVTFADHLIPFTIIFVVWSLVFYIADLYGKRIFIFKHQLPAIIIKAQLVNSLIAVLFFYLVPYFGITPKTILFLSLIFSGLFIFFWRLYVLKNIYRYRKERALLVGEGPDVQELRREFSENPGYNLEIVNREPLRRPDARTILSYLSSGGVSTVVVDIHDPYLASLGSDLYRLMSSRVKFIDFETLYEEIFDRVPLSFIKDSWLLEHISLEPKRLYEFFKRLMDIIVSVILLIVSGPIILAAALAIKLEDGGPVFIVHERIGKNGRLVKMRKLRSMKTDNPLEPPTESGERITRVGRFLRKTRIDELPQLWSVPAGGLSLVGPRPEAPFFVREYQKEIPYYDVRHAVSPGLSGWAQIHFYTPAYDAATNAVKLAYELYYIKNRSFWLDFKIALKTIRILLSRKGI